MNKIKILLLGFAAISASSLCMAVAAAPPPASAIEKVISFDAPAPAVLFDVASCDIDYLKSAIDIEREAVSYAVRQPTAGRNAVTYAKVSAHGRTCRLVLPQTLTEYGKRM